LIAYLCWLWAKTKDPNDNHLVSVRHTLLRATACLHHALRDHARLQDGHR
jgi:hypothetical protein